MTESNDSKIKFAGTYFDRDSVLRLARVADYCAWGVFGVYFAQVSLSLTIFALQVARHLIYLPGLTDYAQQVVWIIQPFAHGLLYFVGLKAIGKALLILMDMEENTRRAARK